MAFERRPTILENLIIGIAGHRPAFTQKGPFGTNERVSQLLQTGPAASMSDLLLRNAVLARHNRQLTQALRQLKSASVAPKAPFADLTVRQQQVMDLVLAGQPSKNIAADLNISQRTVENHRAAIMRKTGATSLPAPVRIAMGAAALCA